MSWLMLHLLDRDALQPRAALSSDAWVECAARIVQHHLNSVRSVL